MSRGQLRAAAACAALGIVVGGLAWRAHAGGQAAGKTSDATRDLWTIGIYTGASPLHLTQAGGTRAPVLTGADVTDMPDLAIDTVAHPSLVRAGDRYYMFFTAKDLAANKGGIGLAESADGLTWTFTRTVVREPWVLSGPHLFEWDGAWYMVAESYTEPFVRLYRATDFPRAWAYERDLITGRGDDQFISPTLLRHEGRWYLFTTPGGNDTLRLHYAADLTGTWTEHPASPIVRKDLNSARPAGRPFVWQGSPYRLAQDCEPTYGLQVHAFRITTLSPTAYAEEPVTTPLVAASGQGWNARAMHHVDAVQVSGGAGTWIAAVDALGAAHPR
jgi:hypothetical protein